LVTKNWISDSISERIWRRWNWIYISFQDVINLFVAEIIYHTGKVAINFKKYRFKAIEVIFPQLKNSRWHLLFEYNVLISSFLHHFFLPICQPVRNCANITPGTTTIKMSAHDAVLSHTKKCGGASYWLSQILSGIYLSKIFSTNPFRLL
jgi:hypothetical protein